MISGEARDEGKFGPQSGMILRLNGQVALQVLLEATGPEVKTLDLLSDTSGGQDRNHDDIRGNVTEEQIHKRILLSRLTDKQRQIIDLPAAYFERKPANLKNHFQR